MGLLAEQIVIDCAPSALEELFSDRAAGWIAPLLRLAGDEGEAAGLVLLGERPDADRRQSPRRRGHEVAVGRGGRNARGFRVDLRWRTTHYRALFAEFHGVLEIRALDDQAVLSVEGLFVAPTGATGSGTAALAARRAAEAAMRSLLGHLRSATEASSFSRS